MKDSASQAAPANRTLSGRFEQTWEIPFPAWPETVEIVKECFHRRGIIQAYSEGIVAILYENAPELPKRHRHRYSLALAKLSECLQDLGFDPLIAGELQEIAFALEDLDKGIVHDFLKPKKCKPGDRSDVWASRALFAISVKILIEKAGNSPRDAAMKIALVLARVPEVVAPKSRNLQATVYNWYRQFDEKRETIDGRAQGMFSSWNELFDAYGMKLLKENGVHPSVDDIAAQIALHGFVQAVSAQSDDQYRKTRETLIRRAPRVRITPHS